jgi:hypothetical protein
LKSLFSPFLIAVALVAAIPLQAAAQERKTLIRVTVDASDVPVTLEIVKDGALRPSKLEPIQGQPRTFGIDLGDPFATAGSNVLTIPYIVAARWGALGSEELFLEIRRSVTQAVDADILNVRSAGTRQEIEQIERLSKSNYSVVISCVVFSGLALITETCARCRNCRTTKTHFGARRNGSMHPIGYPPVSSPTSEWIQR